MQVNIPVNVGVTDLIKWVGGHVHRYSEEDKKRKIFAMAKYCARRLKLPDWDIVVWPTQTVTSDLLDVVVSTKGSDSESYLARVARQLSGFGMNGNSVHEYVSNHLGIAGTKQVWDIVGTLDARSLCFKYLNMLVIHQDITRLAIAVTDEDSSLRGKKIGSLFPLWTFCSSFSRWSPAVANVYNEKWGAAVQELFFEMNSSNSSNAFHPEVVDYVVDLLDVLATIETWEELRLGASIKVSDDYVGWDWKVFRKKPKIGSTSHHRTIAAVLFQVAFQFLTAILMNEYATYLLECMRAGRKKTPVGAWINRVQLRSKHVFNKKTDAVVNETQEFFSLLPHRVLGASAPLIPTDTFDFDLLESMAKVLGAEEHFLPSIQLSVLERELQLSSFQKNSFLGKLTRRKVRLLKCENDRALVIPYLNKIVLNFNDERWARDDDALAQQPFFGKYDEGVVRRAANIMLALKHPKEGNSFVSGTVYDLIVAYAKRGELYSEKLRDHLLSVLWLEHRVCIRALTVSARQVFDDDGVMVAALVRELIHDCLEMKSDFDAKRNADEDDAYYEAVYLRSGFSVSNNVRWGVGVPLMGIECSATENARMIWDQVFRVKGGRATLSQTWRYSMQSFVVNFWVPLEMRKVAFVGLLGDKNLDRNNRSIFLDEVFVVRYSPSLVMVTKKLPVNQRSLEPRFPEYTLPMSIDEARSRSSSWVLEPRTATLRTVATPSSS